MKYFIFISIFLLSAAAVSSQSAPGETVATATGHTFTVKDLPAPTQATINALPSNIAKARSRLLEIMTDEAIIASEAKVKGVTPEKLRSQARATAPKPTEAEIKAIYEGNLDALDNKPLDEVRKPIIKFLTGEAEKASVAKYVDSIRSKYKIVPGKDVNGPGLNPTDLLLTAGTEKLLVSTFEENSKLTLYEVRQQTAEKVLAAIDQLIFSTLVLDEAKSLDIDASELMAREITGKMKDFSDEERADLEGKFSDKLFSKYTVKILYKEPDPIVENVSVDDDPSQGPANAPVTIIMFSDFQCSACAVAHPVLKKVIAEYPGKIKFVVRDFPLVSVHPDSLNAARAANAAREQGKFFEYLEILYTHQSAQDDASLKKYALDLGLKPEQFELTFNSDRTAAEIRKDMADGDDLAINSTPTIFVNGVRVRQISAEGFRRAIDHALKK